jgi:hypothetical protein
MAMQGRGHAISILVFVAALLAVATAKNHDVGGALAWDYPAGNDPGYYDTWASQQKFAPGDTLSERHLPPPLVFQLYPSMKFLATYIQEVVEIIQ